MNKDKVKIFAIDDEKDLRDLYESVLSTAFSVSSFASPVQALSEVDNGNVPTAFVTDLMMPQMNGIQLVQELRRREINKPVVVISACADKENAIKALELGVFAMVEKPFSNRHLISTIKQAALTGLQDELIKDLLQRYKGVADNMREFLQFFKHGQKESPTAPIKTANDIQNLLGKLEKELSIAQIQYDNLDFLRATLDSLSD